MFIYLDLVSQITCLDSPYHSIHQTKRDLLLKIALCSIEVVDSNSEQ